MAQSAAYADTPEPPALPTCPGANGNVLEPGR